MLLAMKTRNVIGAFRSVYCRSSLLLVKTFSTIISEFDYWLLSRGWPFNRWPLYGGCLDLAHRIGWGCVFDKTSKDEWSERARRLEVLGVFGKVFQVREQYLKIFYNREKREIKDPRN